MLENNNGSLSSLAKAGIELPSNALGIFSKRTKTQPISIVLKLANEELCTLQFNLDNLNSPDKAITQTVGATVEALLNRIPLIQTVQNKN
ncbi:hypothetical protein [Acinetobacter tandoii]|uniref:Uncharacterized protein n=1 Tax=Acinetobacter tandoii DSM 14970 = CIP 107469 TaxID=1120927 RepID=R9B4D8_9GAMM|nr:hypothetical protein [Acinetobacter tandoii]EOR07246.1 hypothetical protein I593_02133 [Acinetobacter tandoii DSM 14970 = CIP 107469]